MGGHLASGEGGDDGGDDDKDGLDNETFMVFELLPGDSLHERLHGSKKGEAQHLSTEEVVRLLYDITSGMAYLHESRPRVVHHDLKPRNVLFDKHGRAKVIDFGLACTKDATSKQGCVGGCFAGSVF